MATNRRKTIDTAGIEVRRQGPGWAWQDRNVYRQWGDVIGAHRFAVYCALTTYADDAGIVWPSVDTLADGLSVSQNTVRKALRHLADCGLIQFVRQSGGRSTHTILICNVPARDYARFPQPERKAKSPRKATVNPSPDEGLEPSSGDLKNATLHLVKGKPFTPCSVNPSPGEGEVDPLNYTNGTEKPLLPSFAHAHDGSAQPVVAPPADIFPGTDPVSPEIAMFRQYMGRWPTPDETECIMRADITGYQRVQRWQRVLAGKTSNDTVDSMLDKVSHAISYQERKLHSVGVRT
jgi:hypothetical protein